MPQRKPLPRSGYVTDQRPVVLITRQPSKPLRYHDSLDCAMVKAYPNDYHLAKKDDVIGAGYALCGRCRKGHP